MKNKIFIMIFGIIFLAVGIFVLVNGGNMAKKCTEPITAEVINIEKSESTDEDGFTSYTYTPIVEYTVGDKTVAKSSGKGASAPEYQIGDKIDLLYNPNNVEEFIIAGDNSYKIIGIVGIVVGALVLIAGIFKRF